MKRPDDHLEEDESMDWRERLYLLPRDEGPVHPFFRWYFHWLGLGVCTLFLFTSGVLFLLTSGGFAGLAIGIGPEQTGGALFLLLGSIFNLIVGVILFGIIDRFYKRIRPRFVFYSFTAPVFLFVVFLIIGVIGQLML